VTAGLGAAGAAASRTAAQVDAVFWFIAAVCLFFFLLVEGLLIGFAIRYRRRRGREEPPGPAATGHALLEAVWIAVPSLVVVAFFVYGYLVFRDLRAPRAGAQEIYVTARQFLYEFRYPDGRRGVNELRVPEGRPVKLVMTSEDVIHGFYLPAYRIKQDVLPGRYTTLYLEPDRAGTFDIFCTQYCGVGHSSMRARLVVMPPQEYARWAAAAAAEGLRPPAERGRELAERAGCLGCHSTDGSAKIGPSFRGLFGRRVTLAGGTAVTADEEYIRESILDPGAKVVEGFPNIMPTFKTILSGEEVSSIVAYLKTLDGGRGKGKERKEREEREEEGERR